MAESIVTPLQLAAAASLLNNQGINSLPADLISALNDFNQLDIVDPLNSAINYADSLTWCSATTLNELQTMGNVSCPPLGNSIPPAYTNLVPVQDPMAPDASSTNPAGFSGLIEQTGNNYLGNGDAGRFAQGFLAVANFINTTNKFITSSVNADNYLGPTFTNMNDLITGNITSVSSAIDLFGLDLYRQGQLVDTAKLDIYGTPAALMQQISKVGKIQGTVTPTLETVLLSVGLTKENISDLVNDNRRGLFNPGGLTDSQFDRLQKLAYTVMPLITGDDLQQILDILDITTPGIDSLDDLLNPVKTFPLSYSSLQTPSPNGAVPIFDASGSVNSNIKPIADSYLPIQSGCDTLSKIVGPATAVPNKAIQVALQSIPGIANSSWPELAQAVATNINNSWTPDQEYLPNTVVSIANVSNVGPCSRNGVPAYYQSQQEVPVGISLNNTDYWQPVELGNLVTLDDLPLINNLTAPVSATVVDYFAESVATGTGSYGKITFCDILGTAIDNGNINALLTTATTAIQDIIDDSGAATLLDIYQRIENVADGTYGNPLLGPVTVPAGAGAGTYNNSFPYTAGDLALQTLIPLANTEIDNIVAAYPTECNSATTAFDTIAEILSKEKTYLDQAGIDYGTFTAGNKTSVYAFIQSLPTFAEDKTPCGAWDFLSEIMDTSTAGGQAAIGSLREANNINRLEQANLSPKPATQIPVGATPGGDFVNTPPDSSIFATFPCST